MAEPWMPDSNEASDEFEQLFGQPDERWRGELHFEADEEWRGGALADWDDDTLFSEEEEEEIWGDDSFDEAGPWLFRNPQDDDPIT